MSEKLVLIGGGGHCASVIDIIEIVGRFSIAGILDAREKVGGTVSGYAIIATDEDIPRLALDYENFLVTVGQIKSPETRIRLYHAVKDAGARLPGVVAPSAVVSGRASIGEGTVVMHQALVNAGTAIGVNCIINSKALVEHDVVVGDHCHISTAAVVNGGVVIGDGAFIGSASVLREGVTIGKNAVIGCGAVVVRDVGEGEVVKG